MKKLQNIIVLSLVCIFFSCSKDDSTTPNNETSLNKVVTISDDLSIVEANLIETDPNLYAIEIKITHKKTKETLPVIVHKFIPDNTKEIMNNLPTRMKSFNGTFVIEVEGQILHKSLIQKGIVKSTKINIFEIAPFAKGRHRCTFDGITNCAEEKLESMDWIEYSFCVAGAPLCLAEIYLSCGWKHC